MNDDAFILKNDSIFHWLQFRFLLRKKKWKIPVTKPVKIGSTDNTAANISYQRYFKNVFFFSLAGFPSEKSECGFDIKKNPARKWFCCRHCYSFSFWAQNQSIRVSLRPLKLKKSKNAQAFTIVHFELEFLSLGLIKVLKNAPENCSLLLYLIGQQNVLTHNGCTGCTLLIFTIFH